MVFWCGCLCICDLGNRFGVVYCMCLFVFFWRFFFFVFCWCRFVVVHWRGLCLLRRWRYWFDIGDWFGFGSRGQFFLCQVDGFEFLWLLLCSFFVVDNFVALFEFVGFCFVWWVFVWVGGWSCVVIEEEVFLGGIRDRVFWVVVLSELCRLVLVFCFCGRFELWC